MVLIQDKLFAINDIQVKLRTNSNIKLLGFVFDTNK